MPDQNQRATEVIPDKNPSLPREFGGYRLLRSLTNGMALVYLAEQKNPKRRVVVKIPRGGLLLTEESRRRFLREVELAANADHAGIVPVLEAGEIDGSPYYTMPYIEGKPIDQYLASNCPKLEDKLALFRQLCEVVGALHKNGLIHRDLKPANVLVDTHGSIRLLDFGLAKSALELSDVSLSPAVMGTLDYMAPEQAGSATEVGPQADVYAIGVMLYKAVTGESPYPISKDITTQLRRIAETPPKAPNKFNRELPALLVQLILRCLDKDPAKRPATAREPREALATIPITTSGKPRSKTPLILAATLLAISIAGYAVYQSSQGSGTSPNTQPATEPTNSSLNQQPSTLEAHTYTAQHLKSLRGLNNTQSATNSTIPTAYWPLYNQVKQELQNNFDRRRQGALIVGIDDDSEVRAFTILQGDRNYIHRVDDSGAVVIYLDGNHYVEIAYEKIRERLHLKAKAVSFHAIKF